LFRRTVQLGFCEEIPAGALQYLFAALAAFGTTFYARHGLLLFVPGFRRLCGWRQSVLVQSLFTRLFFRLRLSTDRSQAGRTLSLVRDHPHDFRVISVADQGALAELLLPLGVLRGKDMALKSLGPFDLTGPGLLEPLGCAFVCFHFRHKFAIS